MTIGTFLIHSTILHFQIKVLFNIWLIRIWMEDEGMNQMLDALVNVVGHLLCVCPLRISALVLASIIVLCVQLVILVIEIHVIAQYSHAQSYYWIWFARLLFSAAFVRPLNLAPLLFAGIVHCLLFIHTKEKNILK